MHQIPKIDFFIKLYMFRTSSVPIIRSYSSTLRSNLTPLGSGPINCMYVPIAECTAITPDDGQRRCLKHVEFYDKINFGYLMHLVGCFIRSLSRCTVT
jgi:hypothetical protein